MLISQAQGIETHNIVIEFNNIICVNCSECTKIASAATKAGENNSAAPSAHRFPA